MYKVIQKQIRESIDIPFHSAETSQTISTECKQYFFSNYILTGKNIDHTSSISEDGLSCEVITLWESEEAFNQFKNDPNVAEIIADRQQYCVANNITKSVSASQM